MDERGLESRGAFSRERQCSSNKVFKVFQSTKKAQNSSNRVAGAMSQLLSRGLAASAVMSWEGKELHSGGGGTSCAQSPARHPPPGPHMPLRGENEPWGKLSGMSQLFREAAECTSHLCSLHKIFKSAINYISREKGFLPFAHRNRK